MHLKSEGIAGAFLCVVFLSDEIISGRVRK